MHAVVESVVDDSGLNDREGWIYGSDSNELIPNTAASADPIVGSEEALCTMGSGADISLD